MKADPNCLNCGDLFSVHGMLHGCSMFIAPSDTRRAAEAERAAVVAWLRERGHKTKTDGCYINTYDIAADANEARAHLKEPKDD